MYYTNIQPNPIISLTPVVTDTNPFVSFIPIQQRILNDPSTILYDPFRTFETYYPNLAYYVSYPDLNTDVKLQTRVLNKIWNLLADEWIYTYTKVFRYIKGTHGKYSLVDSLSDAEKNSTGNETDKAEWILSNFYKKSSLAATIEKYRTRANVNWWDLDSDVNQERLKDFIYNQMRRKILVELSE